MRRTMTLVLAFTTIPALGFAHVTVRPGQSMPGAEERYTVRVPTEGQVATTSVQFEVPAGITVTDVPPADGVQHDVKRSGDRVVTIVWTKEIPPKQVAEFTFVARNPASGEQITYTVVGTALRRQESFIDASPVDVTDALSTITFDYLDVDDNVIASPHVAANAARIRTLRASGPLAAVNVANEVERAMAPLTDREKEVLRLRYGLGTDREHTPEEIGKHLSVTRERVRQIESRALKKLHSRMTGDRPPAAPAKAVAACPEGKESPSTPSSSGSGSRMTVNGRGRLATSLIPSASRSASQTVAAVSGRISGRRRASAVPSPSTIQIAPA